MLLPHETQQRAPRWLEAPSRRTHPDHPSSASSTSPRPPNAFQAAQPPLKASTPPRTAVTREAQPTQPSSTTTRDRHTPMEEAIRAAVVEEFAQQPHMAPQQPDQPAAMQAADNAIGSLVPLAVAHAINQHQRHAAQPGVLGGVKVLQGHGQQQRVWVALYEAEAGEVRASALDSQLERPLWPC